MTAFSSSTPIANMATQTVTITPPQPSALPSSTPEPLPTARSASLLLEALRATIEESPTLKSNRFGEDVVLKWVPGWIHMFQATDIDPLLHLEDYQIRDANELSFPPSYPVSVYFALKPTAGDSSLWYKSGTIIDEGGWFFLAILFTFDFENDTMMVADIHLCPPWVFQREYDASIANGLSEIDLLENLASKWLEEYTVEGVYPFAQLDDYSIDQIEPYTDADGRELYRVTFSVKPVQNPSNWTSGAFSGSYDSDGVWFRGVKQSFGITYQGNRILFESLPGCQMNYLWTYVDCVAQTKMMSRIRHVGLQVSLLGLAVILASCATGAGPTPALDTLETSTTGAATTPMLILTPTLQPTTHRGSSHPTHPCQPLPTFGR